MTTTKDLVDHVFMVRKNTAKTLTEVELELMTIIWKLGQASVADVLAELPPDRKLAYTSVSTILRILEQKKILGTKKEGRGHLYIPKITKTEYEGQALKNIVKRVFDDAPVSIVSQLLSNFKISPEELRQIKEMIAKKESEG